MSLKCQEQRRKYRPAQKLRNKRRKEKRKSQWEKKEMIEADRIKRNLSRLTGYTQGERHLISKLGRVLRSHARYVHSTVQLYTIYGLISSIARSLCGPELLETQVPSRRRLMLPTSKVHDQSPRFWGLSRHSYGVRNHSLRGSRVQVFSPPVFPLGFSSLAPTARQKLIRYKSAVKSWQGYRIQHRCTPCSLVHPSVRLSVGANLRNTVLVPSALRPPSPPRGVLVNIVVGTVHIHSCSASPGRVSCGRFSLGLKP